MHQQLIDEETREPVDPEHRGRGYEVARGAAHPWLSSCSRGSPIDRGISLWRSLGHFVMAITCSKNRDRSRRLATALLPAPLSYFSVGCGRFRGRGHRTDEAAPWCHRWAFSRIGLRRNGGRIGVPLHFMVERSAATRRLVFSILGGAFYFEGRGPRLGCPP
jgi:hypothetical protein